MSKNYFSDIIKKFVNHRYSPKTEEKIQRWIIEEEHRAEKDEEIRNFWQSLDFEPDKSVYKALDEVNKKLNVDTRKKKFISTRFFRVAAVLIPFLFIAGLIVYFTEIRDKTIVVYVPYGEQQKIILPDQSTVWLNSGSTIRYSETFAKNNRTVYLSGEAYFSIVRDTLNRFTVETENLNIQVLGTEFNVTAYPEDSTIVTSVTMGKVQVLMQKNKECFLTASQRIIYDKSTFGYAVDSVVAGNVSTWRSGELIFEKKTLPEILKVLERTYDVTIEMDYALSDDKKLYTVKFVQQENIEQIMNVLGEMIGFSHTTEKQIIKIKKTL